MHNNLTLLFTELLQNSQFIWAVLLLFLSLSLFGLIRSLVWLKSQRAFMNLRKIRQGTPENQAQGKNLQWGLCLLFVCAAGSFLFGFLEGGLGFLTSAGVIIGINYKNKHDKNQQLKQQIPLFMRALGSTLKAGYSVPQALEFVASEAVEPLSHKLKSGQRLLQMQQPLEAVLAEWRQKIAVPEFNFLADSLKLQSHSGGNLVSICNAVALRLDERRQLEQDIRSFTAQGKMSGLLMALLWPVSLALFAWLSPSHTEVLFSTLPGQILLGVSFFLELIGFYFIARLVRLKI